MALLNIFQRLGLYPQKHSFKKYGSTSVSEHRVIEKFEADANNTFLVSFPRTGSHWLRMLMELYFERPSLVRVFYYPEKTNYLTLHTHDNDLSLKRRNVIYLYRNPVDTVFSQLNYDTESLSDKGLVELWTRKYSQHLNKWLNDEDFTERKTLINYDRMRSCLEKEFSKVTSHFGQALEVNRLKAIAFKVTKTEVRKKTVHDPKVVRIESNYELRRKAFRDKYYNLIWSIIDMNGITSWFEDAFKSV